MDISTLISGVEKLDIDLNNSQFDSFKSYKKLLKEWNEKIDITTITDDVEIDIKHFLDSLTAVETDLFEGKKSIIDVGTGGGFPGLPLKIYNGELRVTLLDSLNKRINFLNEVISDLELKDIEAIHGRAEELGRREDYREQYDVCVSRAVASLDTLVEYCMPFVKPGGYFVSMKGPEPEVEIEKAKKGIQILGGKIVDTKIFTVPESNIEHSLIVIKKINKTPKKYPRAGGKPRKNPL